MTRPNNLVETTRSVRLFDKQHYSYEWDTHDIASCGLDWTTRLDKTLTHNVPPSLSPSLPHVHPCPTPRFSHSTRPPYGMQSWCCTASCLLPTVSLPAGRCGTRCAMPGNPNASLRTASVFHHAVWRVGPSIGTVTSCRNSCNYKNLDSTGSPSTNSMPSSFLNESYERKTLWWHSLTENC